jgi:nickel/cobalt transporter (NiCoT) family protein
MVGAYGWAFANPIRKLWYNLTITAVSVLVALLIGGVQVLGLLADKLAIEGGVWSSVKDLKDSLGTFGVFVIGLFVLCWIVSALIYRWNRYDELGADVARSQN